jgi:hypothetical protein
LTEMFDEEAWSGRSGNGIVAERRGGVPTEDRGNETIFRGFNSWDCDRRKPKKDSRKSV